MIIIIAAFNQQFQPVFALCTFLQGNLEFGNEIGTAMPIECLSNIGADTGSGANELIGENAFPFGTLDFIAYFNHFQSEGFRLG